HHQLADDLAARRRFGRYGRALDRLRRRAQHGESKGDLAEGDRVLEAETSGGDPGAVDAGPVRAAEVLHLDPVGAHRELGVASGDGRVVDRDVARDPASNQESASFGKLERLVAGGADEAKRGHAGIYGGGSAGDQARCASASARSTARALASVSRHSAAGSESATMPAPACTQARPARMMQVRIVMAVSM